MIITGYHVYRLYVTYKAHFNNGKFSVDKYDFNLLNPSYETYLDTKGISYYECIATKLKKDDVVRNLFIVAFMDDPRLWIGDIYLNLNEYLTKKDKWEAKLASLAYLFKKDCIYMVDKGLVFDDSLPEFVFQEYLNTKITVETFIILKKLFNMKALDNNVAYDYSYSSHYSKYETLLVVDTDKYKNILKEVIMANRD